MPRDHRPTECLGAPRQSLLAPDATHFPPVSSDLVLQPQVCYVQAGVLFLQHMTAEQITPALKDFRVSLRRTQSESEYVVTHVF